MTTLVVTNDFPPRVGGIETFVRHVCRFLFDDVVVLTRAEDDVDATNAYDRSQPFEVHRLPGPLLPTPAVARHAAALMQDHGATRVVFGAAAPLGLLAPSLRAAGARTIVALSHGHEVWWATVPGARSALRRIGRDVDAVGVISSFTRRHIAAALAPSDRAKLVLLPPPVDVDVFAPGPGAGDPVVLAAARFVRQKGLDLLLDAWPLVLRRVPQGRLRIMGDGPQRSQLVRKATLVGNVDIVSSASHDLMPEFFRSGRVFVSPVRTRLAGLYAEGLGLVACEAAACGLPVVVGNSGGAPETVIDEVTGSVVDPRDPAQLAASIVGWLEDPAAAREAGLAGRRHVTDLAGADKVAVRIRGLLGLPG